MSSNTGTIGAIDDFVFRPLGDRKPSVLVLNRHQALSGLKDFFKEYSPTKIEISDKHELGTTQRTIENSIKYIKPAKKLATYANAVLEGVSLTESGFSMGLSGLLNHQPPCATDALLPKLFLINEDDIRGPQLSEFLSLFQQIDKGRLPATIFVSNTDKVDSAVETLSACGSNVSAQVLTGAGAKHLDLHGSQCSSGMEFVEMFLSEGDGACVATNLDELFPENDWESSFIKLATRMMKIQSLFRLGKKFECGRRLKKLQNEIERLRTNSIGTEFESHLLSARAILNLWEAFVFENHAEKIENSISIADHLNDDLLLAHCLKLTGLIHGYSDLSRQMFEKSERIFSSRGEIEQALFVQNNILVNSLYSSSIDSLAASKLTNFVTETTPYIRRATTFHSNTGLAHLLTGQNNEALKLFERATLASGPAINVLTSETNLLVAMYLSGESVNKDEIWRIFNRIKRSKIPKDFNYQQTAMLGNLWKLAESDKQISKAIKKYLRESKFMDYKNALDSANSVLACAVENIPSVKKRGAKKLPGLLGEYIQQHHFVLGAHVFYR